jgi:hypothetical protein
MPSGSLLLRAVPRAPPRLVLLPALTLPLQPRPSMRLVLLQPHLQ